MKTLNLMMLDLSIWTILMFIVMFVMLVLLITHHIVYRNKQEDLQYKLDNQMTSQKK